MRTASGAPHWSRGRTKIPSRRRHSAKSLALRPMSQYRKFPQVGVTAYPTSEMAWNSCSDCSVLFSMVLRMWAESSRAASAPAWARDARDQLSRRDPVPDSRSGKSVHFGQRPQHYHIAPLSHIIQRTRRSDAASGCEMLGKFVVSFVQNENGFWNEAQEMIYFIHRDGCRWDC